MRLVILGAPGAGKGTQAEILSKKLDIPTISTGVIIRNAIKANSVLGIEAKKFIEKGELVPDEVMIKIIGQRLYEPDCKNGFILDGFPRTVFQAEALDEMNIKIDTVLSLDVDDEVILERLSGRRECPNCRATYHVTDNPSKDGIHCDNCHEVLISREDDRPEIVSSRLSVYHMQTEKLKDYYISRNILRTATDKKSVEDTTKEVFRALGMV